VFFSCDFLPVLLFAAACRGRLRRKCRLLDGLGNIVVVCIPFWSLCTAQNLVSDTSLGRSAFNGELNGEAVIIPSRPPDRIPAAKRSESVQPILEVNSGSQVSPIGILAYCGCGIKQIKVVGILGTSPGNNAINTGIFSKGCRCADGHGGAQTQGKGGCENSGFDFP